jgi:hypothetical protein
MVGYGASHLTHPTDFSKQVVERHGLSTSIIPPGGLVDRLVKAIDQETMKALLS